VLHPLGTAASWVTAPARVERDRMKSWVFQRNTPDENCVIQVGLPYVKLAL